MINAPFVGAFIGKNAQWAAIVVLVGSLVCMLNVIVCAMLGQPRIYFQMAKDVCYATPFWHHYCIKYFTGITASIILCTQQT